MQDFDLWSPGYKMSQLHYFIRWDVDVINVFMRNVLVTFDLSLPHSKSSWLLCQMWRQVLLRFGFLEKEPPWAQSDLWPPKSNQCPSEEKWGLGLKFEVIPSGGRFKAYFFCYVVGNISSIFNRRALTSASELPGTTTQIPHRETPVQSASIWTQIRECW